MYQQHKEYVDTLQSFTQGIVEQRRKDFQSNRGGRKNEEGIKRKAALLDMLLEAAAGDEYSLDDEGIREEVDTFMFEVS